MNWREAPMPATPLTVLLPCKPDRAQREVDIAGASVSLSMQGCEAGGATFAVSHVLSPDSARAPELLRQWQAGVLAHVHAAAPTVAPFHPPQAWAMAESQRLQAQGQAAGGVAVWMDAAWFARVDATGVHLFHAALFAPRPMPEAAETFFSSLALR